MGNIVLLDDLTINKIAAGEVVERPASVVKELVENSIDAGATNISIEIKNGGISYIRITDNGKGIASDDMEIAFERHATSKIRQAEDLDTVKSMGFRGEALASVSAIANVELVSKQWEADIGNRIVVEAGNVLEKNETGAPAGTTITVKNLFFNTPVRYKFLKKDYTEAGYIEDAITRLALINPNISFKLINNGKVIIKTYGDGNLNNAVYSIFGKEIASNIVNVNYEYEGITVKGVVGKPEIARSNRANQIFFVNKRYVKDKTLTSATEQAFKDIISAGKFGFLILNIDIEPAKVDVNVHPAKLEVRFAEDNIVFKAVYHAIKEALLRTDLAEDTINTEKNQTTQKMELMVPEEKKLFRKLFNKNKKQDWEIEEPSDSKNYIANIYNKKHGYNFKEDEIAEKEEIENNENIENFVAEENENYDNVKKQLNEMNLDINTNVFEKIAMLQKQVSADLEKNPNIVFDRSKLEDEKRKLEELRNPNKEQNQVAMKFNTESTENQDSKLENNIVEIETEKNGQEVFEDNEDKLNIEDAIKEVTEYKEENYEVIDKKEIVEENTEELNKEDVTEGNTELKEELNKEYETEANVEDEKENYEENNSENIEESVAENEETTEKVVSNNQILKSYEDFDTMYEKIFGRTLKQLKDETKEKNKEDSVDDIVTVEGIYENNQSTYINTENNNYSMFEERKEYRGINYKFIGIAFSEYIIIEIKKELYIIDEYAANERIMYEKLKKNFYSDEHKNSQMLLLPDIINLNYKEMDIARDNWKVFERAGFEIEEFGENTIKLIGVPEVCFDLDTKELFIETLGEINTVARTAKQEIEEKFLATIARKAAVKSNVALNDEGVKNLLEELLKLPNPFKCPQGNPTAIKMNKFDLEKKFSRRK